MLCSGQKGKMCVVVVWYWGLRSGVFTSRGWKQKSRANLSHLSNDLLLCSFHMIVRKYPLLLTEFLQNHVSVFPLPTTFASERERVAFFSVFLFFYCVKSPCTNPTVLLLSSGPWKWTGCKTCRVHISQISTETPPQTLSPYSNSYLYLCSAQ